MKETSDIEWNKKYAGLTGTPAEIIQRYQDNLDAEKDKSKKANAISRRARELFMDLESAAVWEDVKFKWEENWPE